MENIEENFGRTRKMNKKHCITSFNLEDDEAMCITHQTKICIICGSAIDEDGRLCENCDTAGDVVHLSN